MQIIITIANDVDCSEATNLMDDLQLNVLQQEKYKHIIADVKVTQWTF